ncbi:uncharacterized protein LOC128820757 isoform X2 [Vidua macroura]|uniref:uncharacterized protein LOC128820757 isoform X2 n=1 Tax=Vidua macroura TaxID=187451 RepID=UPI0023A820DA|nr:uncharacterized protein LOC128820757 isoform X2 [Vidua macroura]
MNRKAVLKAAFPGGSSGPLAAPAAGSEVMPGRVTADESAGMASPAAGMEDGLEPLGVSAGVSAGKTFQAPFLVAVHKPGSHRREMEGEAVLKAEFPRASSGPLAASAAGREAMPGTVTGEMGQRALLKAALPEGSNCSVPAPDTRREEMPDSATEGDCCARLSQAEQSCWGPSVGDTSRNLGVAARGAHGGERAERESKAPVCPDRA